MSGRDIVFLFSALVFVCPNVAAQFNPPPRSALDVLAVLKSASPNPTIVAAAQKTAATEPPKTGDDMTMARFYRERARAHGQLGSIGRERSDLKLAADHVRRLGKTFWTNETRALAARVIDELATAEWDGGSYLEAERLYDELRALVAGWSWGWELTVAGSSARIAVVLGDVPKAKERIAEAERALGRLRTWSGYVQWEPRYIAALERAKADIFLAQGDFKAAQSSMALAVAGMDKFLEGYKPEPGAMHPETVERIRNYYEGTLSTTLLFLGRLSEAEATARNALTRQLATFGRDSIPTAWRTIGLGWVLLEQGRWDDAGELAQAAITSATNGGALPESYVLRSARALLGSTHTVRGHWKEAATVFQERAEGMLRDSETADRIGIEHGYWAYALIQTGEIDRALQMLDKLNDRISRYKEINPHRLARVQGLHAIALLAKGDIPAAKAQFERAIPVLLQDIHRTSEIRPAALAAIELRWIVEAYFRLLSELYKNATGTTRRELTEAGFRLADAVSNSSVQRALTLSSARATVRDQALAELAKQEQDLANRIVSLEQILDRLLSATGVQRLNKVIADMQRDIEKFQSDRAKIQREIDSRFPDYADLVRPKLISLQEARALLLPGEALVSLYVGDTQTYVWAISADAERFVSVPLTSVVVKDVIARLRRAVDMQTTTLVGFPRFDVDLAHQVYSALLKPVEPLIGNAQTLIVIPRGPLGQIPFSFLVTAPSKLEKEEIQFEEYRNIPWLIRKAAVVQMPSVNAMFALRKYQRSQRPELSFFGVGDPVFGRENASDERSRFRGLSLRNLEVGRTDSTGKPTLSNKLRNLPRLPDTADEIAEIGKLLKSDPAKDILLGSAATETNIKKQKLDDRRVLVFATHGLVAGDLDGLGQPALALSNPEVTGEKDADGLLAMDEILSLKLNADWVVLSACNTAAADGAGAEAVSGLGRAFFYAGARALLVSNWPVETVSARLLTTGVFRLQGSDPGLSRAEAFRRTMLDLIDRGTARGIDGKPLFAYAHPMFWAPFSLVGDGGGQQPVQ